MSTIKTESMSEKDINLRLMPLLTKMHKQIIEQHPKSKVVLLSSDDDGQHNRWDGACLSFESKRGKIYKILGSEWHSVDECAFLNVVEVNDFDTKAWRGTLLESEKVDGSHDLSAEYLSHFDWLWCVVNQLIEGIY